MNRTVLLIALAAVPAACGDPAAPREWDPIEIAASAIEADTIDAIVPVEVAIRIPDGRPVLNLPVLFMATNGFVAGDAAALDWTQAWEAETDGRGRAAVWFRLGSSSTEPARLRVRAGVDEAVLELNVHPGAPVGLRAIPAETALAVSRTHTMAVQTVDRHGNPHPGTIAATLSSRRTDVAQVDGSELTVLAPGKAIIDLSAGALAGTTIVYGMPPGRLALASLENRLDVFDMGVDSLERITDGWAACVSWHPDGEQMLLRNLVIVRLTGEVARIPTGTDSIIAGCGEFTADGAWIFFEGRLATAVSWVSHIWRIRPDGTQLEQITAERGGLPSPSPDGTRVAFKGYGTLGVMTTHYLMVGTIGNAAVDTISPAIMDCGQDRSCVGGITSVRWSPTGEWIAYATKSEALKGGGPYASLIRYGSLVRLVRPDGSETRYIGPPGSEPHHHGFLGEVSWSPDGEWLVGPSFGGTRIRLVQLASGEEVMLNSSLGRFVSAAWTSH